MGTTEQQQTLDRQFAEDFAERYAEAWASRDPRRLAELCTEDVEWHDPGLGGEPLHGRAGVERFAAATFRMAPDFDVEDTEPVYVSAVKPRILAPYRMSGTMTGPWEFFDLAPTGRRFVVEGVDSWLIRDGLIARYDTYYDSADMSRQLGVLPEVGSSADRALTRMQHVQARLQRRSAE